MTIPIISSTSNAQVKQLIQLQKKAKLRAEQDVFIVEGIKMYQEVAAKAARPYVCIGELL